jgi:hypothetical protein
MTVVLSRRGSGDTCAKKSKDRSTNLIQRFSMSFFFLYLLFSFFNLFPLFKHVTLTSDFFQGLFVGDSSPRIIICPIYLFTPLHFESLFFVFFFRFLWLLLYFIMPSGTRSLFLLLVFLIKSWDILRGCNDISN